VRDNLGGARYGGVRGVTVYDDAPKPQRLITVRAPDGTISYVPHKDVPALVSRGWVALCDHKGDSLLICEVCNGTGKTGDGEECWLCEGEGIDSCKFG